MFAQLSVWGMMLLQQEVGFDMVSMWNQMGIAARAVVIIMFLMSAWSIGVMIDRYLAYSAARKQSRQYAPAVAGALREGKSHIRMFGQQVEVRARIRAVDGFSGHADYLEMLAWLMAFNKPVQQVFLVHGEPEAATALRDPIQTEFSWPVTIPREGQAFDLDF